MRDNLDTKKQIRSKCMEKMYYANSNQKRARQRL